MDIFGVIYIADWFLISCVLVLSFYIWSTWNFSRFKDENIPGPKPYPFLGTRLQFFTLGLVELLKSRQKKYGNIYGTFTNRQPVFVVSRDDLLSEILVQQFWNFPNRRGISDGSDIFDSFLSAMKYERWKTVRNILTPTFTSGKLKNMVPQINNCAKQLAENIHSETNKPFDVKELSGCYTLDVTGSVAFGIEVNSQKDPDNIFIKMAKKSVQFQFKPVFMLLFLAPFLLPILSKLKMRPSVFDKDVVEFFEKVTKEAMEERTASKENRGTDFIQLMINAHKQDAENAESVKKEVEEFGATYEKKDNNKPLTDLEVTAQGLLFFLAGYDNTSQTVSFMLYQLAIKPECQEKLYRDVCEVLGDKENIDYTDVGKMTYLDMFLNETLRMYPPVPILDRVCLNDMTINGIQFKKDEVVFVPIVAMHYDEARWPDPEVFNPERFTPEAKKTRGKFDWIPFGYGPRNCIGMRLALLKAKIAVATVVRRQRLVPCDKTEIPLKFDKIGFKVKEGIWISAQPR